MKKKLEAELISIAHRILKLKNKSELIQLHSEAQKVYEKLSVLLFVEEVFSEPQPTIGKKETFEILESAFDNQVEPKVQSREDKYSEEVQLPEIEKEDAKSAVDPTIQSSAHDQPDHANANNAADELEVENEEINSNSDDLKEDSAEEESVDAKTASEIESENNVEDDETDSETSDNQENVAQNPAPETLVEKGIDFVEPESKEEVAKVTNEPISKSEDDFKPAFEWSFEPKSEATDEVKTDFKAGQIAFDDLLGSGYVDPVFVKPEENTPQTIENLPGVQKFPDFRKDDVEIADKTVTLNDRLSKGITVGLNDRIAFVKHLFGNSTEEYNRVLSQLITFNTFEEAQEFIENMVQPDYNNWEGKDEYAARFMEVVEKKFT